MSSSSRSLLDSLGSEILGVMSPVSICMFLVVLLVSALSSPLPSSFSPAALVYHESPSDPTSEKLLGALLNAVIFVAVVAVVTFLLLLLYYYNFTSFLKHYMRFSTFFILSSMGGALFVSLLHRFHAPLDAVSFGFLLLNFSVVGVIATLSAGGFPIVVRQGYMVCLGVLVAGWFTKLPEWTTWMVLMALAVYDLVAVLAPGGPLKLIVELASSRDEDLPAMVYEARPNLQRDSRTGSVEMRPISRPSPIEVVNLQVDVARSSDVNASVARSSDGDHSVIEVENSQTEMLPLVLNAATEGREREGGARSPESEAPSVSDAFSERDGIKLGLGDFVFYSVLVGRAAMYDWMTVYACYLAIISGLGCTLILLSVYQKALPALPISITLGVIFYFLTRLLMEPFVVGASSNLVMF